MHRYTRTIGFLVVAIAASTAFAEKPTEYTLDNGLRVRLVPSPGGKQAIVFLGVRAGFFEEPKGVPHVAHVTEHLAVFDGAPREAKPEVGHQTSC